MSRRVPDPRRLAAASTLVLLAGLGAACGDDGGSGSARQSARPSPTESAERKASPPRARSRQDRARTPAPRDVLAEVASLLERRAAALRGGDADGFAATLAGDEGFLAAQRQYFANLAQLPLARVEYELDRASLVRRDDGYDAVVDLHLQLEGFDAAPALSRARMTFVRARDGFLLAGAATGVDGHGGGAQPWDTGPVEVRRGPGVLGVFDAGSVRHAPSVMGAVIAGVADVAGRVPTAWPRQVVFYAPSDLDFMRSLDQLPGGDPTRIDGLTFTVPAAHGGTAASRFVLNPDVLDEPPLSRNRLVRHEIAHVAMGPLPGVPLWLGEGIAEWISVQPLRPAERSLNQATIDAAERGLTSLPADAGFNGNRSEANYGIAWWACEYVARSWQPEALWSLVGAFQHAGGAASEADVLRRTLGVGPAAIARGAGRLVTEEYGPEPTPAADPGPTGEPSPSGSRSPSGGRSPADEPSGSRSPSGRPS